MKGDEKEITIRDLYPELSEDKLKEAEENLDRYLEHAWRQYQRITADPTSHALFRMWIRERREVERVRKKKGKK